MSLSVSSSCIAQLVQRSPRDPPASAIPQRAKLAGLAQPHHAHLI
jgi:hypothetical protein